MTLPSCNPKLGYGVTQVMSTHYPERLGLAISVNHSPVFQGIWNATKVFLCPKTAAKMTLPGNKRKIKETFDKYFSEELSDWLLTEIKLNKQEPLPQSQIRFWEKPKQLGDHDPRGCPSYVAKYIDSLPRGHTSATSATCSRSRAHKPHPNIVDGLHNRVGQVPPRTPDSASAGSRQGQSHESDTSGSDSGCLDRATDLELSDDKIPENSQLSSSLTVTSPRQKEDKSTKKKPKQEKKKSFLAL